MMVLSTMMMQGTTCLKKVSRLDMDEFNLENISLNTYLSRIKHPEEKDDEE